MIMDASGNLFVANYANATGTTISEFAPGATTPTATLTGVNVPIAMAFDASGNLYVSNFGGTTVSKFAPGATTASATLTGLSAPRGLAFDASGNLFVANANTVSEFTPGATTASASLSGLNRPVNLAFDGGGNLYVLNDPSPSYTGTVSKFAPGATTPSATLTGLGDTFNMLFDASGNLYVADQYTAGAVSAGTTVSVFSPTGPLAQATEAINIQSSLPARPMSIGGTNTAVAGINLTDAELAQMVTSTAGTITFGDSNQTGNITFTTATPATTAGANTQVIQSAGGTGDIILDTQAGAGTALVGGSGTVSLQSGQGGIMEAATNTAGTADISAANVSLTAAASSIGDVATRPIQLATTNLTTNSSAFNTSQFLASLGTVTIASVNAGTGAVNLEGGTFQLGSANAIHANTEVSLADVSGATLDLNNFNQTLAGLSGGGANGGNVMLGSGTLTTGGSTSTTYAGVISGSGGAVIKQGSGNFTLSGANTYTGSTTVNDGALEVDGSIDGSATVAGGATLTGSGTIGGNLLNSGTVNPGSVGGAGTMTISGAFTQTSGGILALDIGGATAGQFDVLSVGGAATLAGTIADSFFNSYAPSATIQTFNVLTDASQTGSFALATPTTGNYSLGQWYQSNKMQLITAVFFKPADSGGDWAAAANWSDGVVPTTLQNVLIPAGVTITHNTFSSDTIADFDVEGTANLASTNTNINGLATLDGTVTLSGI
jgi:autotransporter-associated beta strand protein